MSDWLKEMFTDEAKAALLSRRGGGSSSGNFKKKFKSLVYLKIGGGSAPIYYFSMPLGYAIAGNNGVWYDEEILPTKTLDGIKVSSLSDLHIYFIEDENDVFVYGDLLETGTNEWISLTAVNDVEFGGVTTEFSHSQMTPDTVYVFFYYVEAD